MNIKLYTSSGTYQKTINPNLVKNKVNFSSQINGGLGVLSLFLDLKINDTTFSYGDILKLEKDGTILYAGIVEEINGEASRFQEIEIVCSGYAGLMSRIVGDENGSYFKAFNDTASNMMGIMVDFYNTKYNYLIKDFTDTIGNVKLDTEYSDLLTFAKDVVLLAEDYYWFVNQDGIFKFHPKPTTSSNTLTFQKDIFTLSIEEDSTDIVNELILIWKTSFTTYQDSTSLSQYGTRAKVVNASKVNDQASADIYAEEYFKLNAQPKKKVVITINNGYTYYIWLTFDDLGDQTFDDLGDQTFDDLKIIKTIDNIEPGESIKIVNLDHNLGNNLLISKKVYTEEKVTLYLENYDNFIELIKT